MTFLKDLGNFFSGFAKGIAKGATTVYNKALVPVGKEVVKDSKVVYSKVIRPVGESVIIPIGKKVGEGAGKIFDSGVSLITHTAGAAEKLTDNTVGLVQTLSSPGFLIIGGIAAIIILPKLIK